VWCWIPAARVHSVLAVIGLWRYRVGGRNSEAAGLRGVFKDLLADPSYTDAVASVAEKMTAALRSNTEFCFLETAANSRSDGVRFQPFTRMFASRVR